MKTHKLNYAIVTKSAVLLLSAMLIIFSGCSKEEEAEPEPAPNIPPESTMIMNFSDFANGDTTAFKSGLTYQNWGRAATHVLVWNTVLTITLAVPVASFKEAFNHEPVYDPSLNAWVWSYNFMAAEDMHLAELHGSVMPDGIQWNMYISREGEYNDFLWYSGTSNLSNESGNWILNSNPYNPNTFLLIEWNREINTGNFDIKYTNIATGNQNNGSYIYYSKTSELMDATYNIYNSNEVNFVKINWSRSYVFGQIKDPIFYADENFHCWDEIRQDTDCE